MNGIVLELEADGLQQGADIGLGLGVGGLIVGGLGGVHLVDGDDDLLDTQGLGQEDVLLGLGLGALDTGARRRPRRQPGLVPVIMFLTKSR